MLYRIFIISILFASLAQAAELDPNQIQIIDGKKFFPLQNVKRFHGTPSQPVMLKPKYGNSSPVVASKPAQTSVTPAAPAKSQLPLTQPIASTNNKTANDILSIFAPEDKSSVTPLVPQTNR